MTELGISPVRVLVTGFGPFPGVPHNASASLAHALTRLPRARGIELCTEIIPVAWAEARAAACAAIARAKPHAVLHFGVSKRVTGFEIETRAFNICGSKEDNAGVAREEKPLIAPAAPVLAATLPAFALLQALSGAGYPARLSADAGRYLCNALLYWSLAGAGSSLHPLVTLIHIPAFGVHTAAKPCITMEEAVAGARVLIRASVKAVLRAALGRVGQSGETKGYGSQRFYRNGGSGSRLVRGVSG